MRIKKHISKLLLAGILINNFSFLSDAGTLSPDTRYETFEGSDIKIDNIMEEEKVDVEVEGNTLVNILDYSSMFDLPATQDSNGYFKKGRTVTCNYDIVTSNHISWDSIGTILKAGETYTFVVSIAENSLTNSIELFPYLWSYPKSYKGSPYVNPGYTGKAIVSVEVKDDYKFKLLYKHANATNSGSISISDVMILRGDYYESFTENESNIPQYFEGIKSVGELEGNNLKLSLKNKNLWEYGDVVDNKYIFSGTNWINFEGNRKDMYLNYISKDRSKAWVLLKKGKTYNFNAEGSGEVLIQFVSEKEEVLVASKGSYTPTKDIYITLRARVSDGTDVYSIRNIQIEESSTITSVEAFKKLEFDIPLTEPLRGLPNGTKDRIIKRNGQWVVERRLKEIVLDGTEDYEIFKSATGTTGFVISSIKTIPSNRYIQEVICDTIPSGNHNDFTSDDTLDWSKEYYRISNRATGKVGLYLLMPSSIASTIDEVKDWMSKNNPKVVYILPEAVYEPIAVESSVNLYKETTYISNDSVVPANMRVTVDRVANRAKECSEIAKLNPTAQNLSQARYWINLMKETTLKDDFQNEIGTITNIDDLQLEKKTATANVDLYVKSENTLTMSLSTNSIMFDNFGGTEDMEKLGCLDIQISSSLPYDLNAYLVDELYNSDKSKIMDKEILNIKESSQSSYNLFTGVNNKLTLKANNSAGNFINHSVDLRLRGGITHDKDVYKTVIKFEAEQK